MLILLISAIFPVVIFLYFVNKKDTEKEPPKLLAKCFVWGCIASVPVILIEMLIGSFNGFSPGFLHSFYEAFLVAALVEEGMKLLCLYRIAWKHREFDQYYDGIVYAVFVSLGFALVENILYVAQYGVGVAFMRAILSIPGHGLFGVAMGYFFSLARFSGPKGKKLLWLSFLVPFVFHGLYDFLVMSLAEIDNALLMLALFAGFVLLMVFIWRIGVKYIKNHCNRDKSVY